MSSEVQALATQLNDAGGWWRFESMNAFDKILFLNYESFMRACLTFSDSRIRRNIAQLQQCLHNEQKSVALAAQQESDELKLKAAIAASELDRLESDIDKVAAEIKRQQDLHAALIESARIVKQRIYREHKHKHDWIVTDHDNVCKLCGKREICMCSVCGGGCG